MDKVQATGRDISLDQWIALNDEIAALTRAGMPLDQGLLGFGRDVPGRLGALARALGERLQRGEDLPSALRAEGRAVPPLYAAVVEAGLRAGRLPAALEDLAHFARRQGELRRTIGLALFYPYIVLTLAFALFILFTALIAPRFEEMVREFGLAHSVWLGLLTWLGRHALVWGSLGLLGLASLFLWWVSTGSARSLGDGFFSRLVRRMPWIGMTLDQARAANEATILALLLEHDVPLEESARLASRVGQEEANGSGNPVRRPMLSWLLQLAPVLGAKGVVNALRDVADSYHQRAIINAELIRIFLPAILLLIIGASATVIYGLTLFLPLSEILRQLSRA